MLDYVKFMGILIFLKNSQKWGFIFQERGGKNNFKNV